MKKKITAILLILLVISFGALKLFVIGSPADGSTLAVEVQHHDNQVDIYINSPDSALSISNIRYHYDGTVLHLTVYKVLSSPLYRDGSRCLYYEITDETEIWLSDRLIWTRE